MNDEVGDYIVPEKKALLKLSGVVNEIRKTTKAHVSKGLTEKHTVVIWLTDETKVVLTREVDPFEGLAEGRNIELTIG